jgi:hypothetical protein
VHALTTQVYDLFNANLGDYFFLIKCHLVPPRLVENNLLNMMLPPSRNISQSVSALTINKGKCIMFD